MSNFFNMSPEQQRKWLAKQPDDPPACKYCGAMAGVCSRYPDCENWKDYRIANLERQLTETQKNERRYLWLKDNCVDSEPMAEGDSFWARAVHFEFSSKETLDAAIDREGGEK